MVTSLIKVTRSQRVTGILVIVGSGVGVKEGMVREVTAGVGEAPHWVDMAVRAACVAMASKVQAAAV
jgi:hypothetical protein